MTATTDVPPGAPSAAGLPPRRRVVLWASIGVAVVVAVLVAVLASSSPSGQTTTSSPLIGAAAPPISGPDQSGATVSLTGLRGRWVLVNFAASWCQPCIEETPQLLTFASRHQGGAAPTIVTVEYDQSDLAALRRFLAARRATWPVVDDPQAFVRYGGYGLPESFLVDPAGTVVAKVTGGVVADSLDSLIATFPAQGGVG